MYINDEYRNEISSFINVGGSPLKILNNLFSQGNGDIKKFIIILIAGICLVVIVWPGSNKTDKNTSKIYSVFEDDTETENEVSQEDFVKEKEKHLTDILSSVYGINDVKVMITLKDQGKNIYSDNSGQISQVFEPEIEGVLVCCKGGGDPENSLMIADAVQALFNVPLHKIVVLESK